MPENTTKKTEFRERRYRHLVSPQGFISFQVRVKETDLFIRATRDLTEKTREAILRYRYQIEYYISQHPDFYRTLIPFPEDEFAPAIIRAMVQAGRAAGVGPMAAVAGAVAEFVGRELLPLSPEITIENGGALFISTASEVRVGIFAGASPLSLRLGWRVPPRNGGWGLCTSSGTVGPSLSFGKADAVCVLAPSAALADAAATAIGNVIVSAEDVPQGLESAKKIPGICGVVVIVSDKLGAWGEVELTEI
ncbi:MAG: UPF0280 family protein [Deltaproteobacteria bacterium]|nr:UPF0280 family protein [Deltaproteobacteria bacterium]